MPSTPHSQPSLRVVAAAALVVLLAHRTWRTDAQAPPHRRTGEPVVVVGRGMAVFAYAPVGELSVWSRFAGEWTRVPTQVDERDAAGRYLPAEDGRLDVDDDLVFTLGGPTEQTRYTDWPAGIAPRYERLEVVVTDPLDPAFVAFYYIFRSAPPPGEPPAPAVRWDPTTRTVHGAAYALGLANPEGDGFTGVRSLTLYDHPLDLVDRLKLRGTLRALGFETPVDEENLAAALAVIGQDPSFDPVISGPVRVVLSPNGGFAYADRFALFGGFGALESVGELGIELADARLSLDFSPAAAGAVYTDPNVPAGVTVDGAPDGVPDAPVPAWRRVAFPVGQLVVLSDPVPPGSPARVYYHDDTAALPGDTGDGQSFGDNGVAAPDLRSLVETGFPGEAVVLPPESGVAPETLAENRAAPIAVAVVGGDPRHALTGTPPTPVFPTASPTGPTPGVSTPGPTTPRPTTPTPARTRVPPSLNRDIYLPVARRAVAGGR